MIYRKPASSSTTYAPDSADLPDPPGPDRHRRVLAGRRLRRRAVPLSQRLLAHRAILIPFLILSLAALGLNILTGYAGQLSLGLGGFMAVGAFAAYNFMLRVPRHAASGRVRARRACAPRWSASCSACRACASAASTSRSRRSRRSSSSSGLLDKFGWFTNYDPSGVDHRAADRDLRP